MDKTFIFFCKLAWEGRYRIPIIISIAFMIFDVSLQIDVNVQTRRIRRRPRPSFLEPAQVIDDHVSEDSWITVDEETTTDDEGDDTAVLAN